MREPLDRDRLHALMRALADSVPEGVSIRAYFLGGATAVDRGWREATIDADVYATDERLFAQVQQIKDRLRVNVELTRPEHFVPGLPGTEDRHIFIETRGAVSFFHYDPYAQVFSKVVRGFRQDLEDASRFVAEGLVDPERLGNLIADLPDQAYAAYPSLSRQSVEDAIDDFVRGG